MKKTLIVLFLLLSILKCYTQDSLTKEEENQLLEEDEILDAILGEESEDEFLKAVTKFQFINISLEYNNKTYFSGRDIGTDQFNVTPQIMYLNSNGLFAGLSGVYYDKFTPEWDYTSATLGYGKSFGKDKTYRWSASYSRYFYTSTSDDNQFTNTITFGLELDNKKKTLGTEITTTYLFGSDNSFQITSSTYGVLSLFKTKKTHLKLRPQLNITMAQQTIQLTRTFIFREQRFTKFIQENDFGLINTQLQIPLQYNVNNFNIELGYNINFPTALKGEGILKNTSSFNLSMSYLFDL
jgi:hypothetical protein